jgi:ComF family protein
MSNLSLARAGRLLLDAVYPPVCGVCGHNGSFLCDACEASLLRAAGPRCSRCWLPLTQPHCQPEPAFAALRSRYRYVDEVRKLVHKFKFGRQSSLAEPLGTQLANLIVEEGGVADALVPVPLRTMGERDRGYNQAALLAKQAGKVLGMAVIDPLQRHGSSAGVQAQAKNAEERWTNVAGAFSLRDGRNVIGMSLLLVDDVATTGATLDACARALLAAGASAVSAVTLARED